MQALLPNLCQLLELRVGDKVVVGPILLSGARPTRCVGDREGVASTVAVAQGPQNVVLAHPTRPGDMGEVTRAL